MKLSFSPCSRSQPRHSDCMCSNSEDALSRSSDAARHGLLLLTQSGKHVVPLDDQITDRVENSR